MTTRSDDSNFENRSYCNIPLSMDDSSCDNNPTNFNSVIHWINSFEFIRPKKNIVRDFSDASKK